MKNRTELSRSGHLVMPPHSLKLWFRKSIFANSVCAFLAAVNFMALASCERLDDDLEKHRGSVQLEQVAKLLSVLPVEHDQLEEVHRAVSTSSGNGYDEEYMMSDLFDMPGKGVGESGTKAVPQYSRAMRDLLREYVSAYSSDSQRKKVRFFGTKATGESVSAEGLGFVPDEKFLADMENSDMQIYWPYSENWDGESLPIISFDPEDGSETSTGYRMVRNEDGTLYVEMLTVDEEMAKETPVWVVNTNSDSDYMTLDLMRRNDPSYGEGGTVIVRPGKCQSRVGGGMVTGGMVTGGIATGGIATGGFATNHESTCNAGAGNIVTAVKGNDVEAYANDGSNGNKTLILKEFTAKRNFDCWLAGASEFFVKAGAVEDFHASTEAELRLYSPSITDFMVVVKRKQVGQPIPFNAVIVSEWSQDMTHCAFMITEDDGGTITQWKCSAIVKVASKSYGFDISLPFNSRDDIVWRGQLSRKYLESNSNVTGHFGDVDLVFEIVDMP